MDKPIREQFKDDLRRAQRCLDTPEFKEYAEKLLLKKEVYRNRIIEYVLNLNFTDRDKIISDLIKLQIELKTLYTLFDMVETDYEKKKVFEKNDGTEPVD